MFLYSSLFLPLKAAADICLRPPGSFTLSPNTARAPPLAGNAPSLHERRSCGGGEGQEFGGAGPARGGDKRQRSEVTS